MEKLGPSNTCRFVHFSLYVVKNNKNLQLSFPLNAFCKCVCFYVVGMMQESYMNDSCLSIVLLKKKLIDMSNLHKNWEKATILISF